MSIEYTFTTKLEEGQTGRMLICSGFFKHKKETQEVYAAEQLFEYDKMSNSDIKYRKQELIDSCNKKVAEYKNATLR